MIAVRHGSTTVTLPSDTEILITRSFDAPAWLVYEAWTTPELVQRWWSPDGTPLAVCEIDLREGGEWRYVVERDGVDQASIDWSYNNRRAGRPFIEHQIAAVHLVE